MRQQTGKLWNVIVVGGGPGGMQAAIAASSEGLETLVLERDRVGGQIGQTPKLENSVFADGGITGPQFAHMMKSQAERMGVTLHRGDAVALSCDAEGIKSVTISRGDVLKARIVVLAMGNKWTELDISGLRNEINFQAFIGPMRALTWNAGNRPVMVYGGGPSAGQAILALADAPGTRMCYSVMRSGFKMPKYLEDRIREHRNVRVLFPDEITLVERNDASGALLVHLGSRMNPFAVNALFLCNGLTPATHWLRGTLPLDPDGRILVTDYATEMPGVFAIGDCRSGSTSRVGVAIGDGSAVVSKIWQRIKAEE